MALPVHGFTRYVTISTVQVNPWNLSRYTVAHTMELSHWQSGGYGRAETRLSRANVASALWSGNTSPQMSVKVATLVGNQIRTNSNAIYGNTQIGTNGGVEVSKWGFAWYSEHTWRYRNWNSQGQEWSVTVHYDISPLIPGGIAFRGQSISPA